MNKFDLLMKELYDILYEIGLDEKVNLDNLKEDLYLLSKDILSEYVKRLKNGQD